MRVNYLSIAFALVASIYTLPSAAADQKPCANRSGTPAAYEGPCSGNLQNVIPLDSTLWLTHNSQGPTDSRGFGPGFRLNFDLSIVESASGANIILGDGSTYKLVSRGKSLTTERFPEDIFATLTKIPGGYEQRTIDGVVTRFGRVGEGEYGVESIISPNGVAIAFSREQSDKRLITGVTSSDGQSYIFVYDGQKVSKIVDPKRGHFFFLYDSNSRLSSVTTPLFRTFAMRYGPGTNLITARWSDDKRPHYMEYSTDGAVVAQILPDGTRHLYEYTTNSVRLIVDERMTSYGYQNGALISVEQPAGRIDIVRDALKRPTLVSHSKLGVLASYTYPKVSGSPAFVAPAIKVVDGQGSSEFGYDSEFRLLWRSEGGLRTTFGYVPVAGRKVLNQTTLPSGLKVNYELNGRGQITQAFLEGILIQSREYDLRGRVVRLIDAEGETQVFTYGVDGRISSRATSNGTEYLSTDIRNLAPDLGYQPPGLPPTYSTDSCIVGPICASSSSGSGEPPPAFTGNPTAPFAREVTTTEAFDYPDGSQDARITLQSRNAYGGETTVAEGTQNQTLGPDVRSGSFVVDPSTGQRSTQSGGAGCRCTSTSSSGSSGNPNERCRRFRTRDCEDEESEDDTSIR